MTCHHRHEAGHLVSDFPKKDNKKDNEDARVAVSSEQHNDILILKEYYEDYVTDVALYLLMRIMLGQ